MRIFSLLRRTLLVLFLSLAVTGGFLGAQTAEQTAQPTAQPPATIYLIRHAEKLTDKRPDLAPDGFRRAALLPYLFQPLAGDPRTPLPKPDFIFATARSKNSNRPVETVMPLSAALNEPINNAILDDDYPELAKELLSGKYAGKVVLVAWHHGKLPALATALGAVPPYEKWPDAQFDRIWVIYWVDGKVKLRDIPMLLMPGDSK